MGSNSSEKPGAPEPAGPDENSTEDPNYKETPEDGVFTKFVKTLTNQNGYQNDGSDPGFQRLNAAGLDSAAAMSGMDSGVIQQYIQGDCVQHYLGNHFVIVDKNDTLYVNGMQNETVMLDTTHLYKSNFLRGVSKNDDVRVNLQRHMIVLGESSEAYGAKHEINAPEEFEWKTKETGLSVAKIDISGMSLDLHATELDIHEYDIEIAGIKTGGFEGYETFADQRAHAAALLNRIGGSIDILGEINAFVSLGFDLPF